MILFFNDLFDYTDFSDVYIFDNLDIPKQRTSPVDLSSFDRKLINFGYNNNMFIPNGRLFADRVGKPTSRNLSVVDYVLSSANMMCKIKDFEF